MAMVLVLLMTCSSVIFAKSGDYQGHWAEKSIQNWIDKGYIKGYADGSFKPENNITRAEFICLVNRSFGFTEQKAVTYKDVKESHWAYNEFQRATGYIAGFEDGTLRPNNKITRQEVAAIITRLLNTKKAKNSEAFLGLDDFEKIPEWSAGAVSAMVNEGYMNLRNGNSFAPAAPATRAEVIAALDAGYLNFVKTKYKEAGTYTGGLIDGSVEINAKDVILENTTINGNLIIGEDVGKGNVTLRKVNVKGDTIVKGGGMDTIIIEDSYIKNLIIEKKDGKVRILAKGSTYIDDVDLQSGGKLEAYNKKSNNFGYVVIAENLSSDEPIILAGNFYQVEIRSGENEIQIASGTIKDLTITKSAKNVKVMTASGAKIDFVEINTPATIDGKGEVGRARVNSDGVRMIEPKETLDKNKDVDKVEIIKPSISTGGDGGGGSSTPVIKAVSAITVTPETMELTVGGAAKTITATVLPTTATNKTVTWTSSNEAVATVANGVVTPITAGTTTITATTVDGGFAKTISVTVTAAPTYAVTVGGDATETTDYTISGASDLTAVVAGTDLTVTAVTDITINGEKVAAGSTKAITVNAATTITINKDVATPETYVVTIIGDATKTTDYTITGADNLNAVAAGTDLTVTAVTNITVNGDEVAASGTKVIKITEATTITINKKLVLSDSKAITSFKFEALSPAVTGVIDEGAKTIALTVAYTTDVTALAPTIGHTGASISPDTEIAQNFESPVTYTVTAEDSSTAEYVVTVTVAPAGSFILTYTAGTGGTITGTSSQTVSSGGDGAAVTAIANEGYSFDKWSDGVTTAERTDKNVTANITVTAQFEINKYTVTFVDHDDSVLKTEEVEEGKSATAPADPTRTGYTFTGWDTVFSNVTSNLTVKAQYNINKYTITFNSDGGSTVASITQDYGTAITPPANPTKTGYTFANWNPSLPVTMPANDLTVTAQYTKDALTLTVPTVTSDLQEGKTNVAVGAEIIGSLTATGGDSSYTYSLEGTDAAKFAIDSSTGKVTVKDNPLTEKTYSITVKVTDGASATAEQAVSVLVAAPDVVLGAPVTGLEVVLQMGATETATASTTEAGAGDWTSSDPSVATVDASTGVVTVLKAGTTTIAYTTSTSGNVNSKEITVYASMFTSQTDNSISNDVATLGLVGNQVSSSMSSVATGAIESDKIKITSLKQGSTIITVKSDKNFEAEIAVTVAVDGTITIGAITKPALNVTYDINEGSGVAPTQASLTSGNTFIVASPTELTAPTGKQFKEWNTHHQGTGTGYAPGDTITMETSHVILYAIWEDIYTVDFVAGENGSLTGTTEFVDIINGTAWETAVTVPSPDANPGFKFKDWTPTFPATVTKNATYTANFVALSTDANLNDLTVDGTSVTDFDADTLIYNVELANGTTEVPTVVATVNHSEASAVVTSAESLPGSTSVLVTAEDGTITKTYTINFTVAAVDKTALTTAITDANTNKATVTVSTDGKHVDPANKWVTEAEMTAYTSSIATAQGVADEAEATQTEVDNAVAALATATSTFDSAKKAGGESSLASFEPVAFTQTGDVAHNNVQYADATAVIAALPKTIEVTLVNSTVVTVPVTWINTGTAYSNATAGNYTFTATWGTMPAGANNKNTLPAPTVKVTVEDRAKINKVVATSSITAPVHGATIEKPTFEVTEGSPAYFNVNYSNGLWEKKNGDGWDTKQSGEFTEGTWRFRCQVRIDEKVFDEMNGTTHKLASPLKVTVGEEVWLENGSPSVSDTNSYASVFSPEYVVTAPEGTELTFNMPSYSVPLTTVNNAIAPYSVASFAEGGTKPYKFSKTSGPEWINVSEAGEISGMPVTAGTNSDLIIRVTDNADAHKEITINVAKTFINPSERTDVNNVVATSSITAPIYGATIEKPTFEITEGSPAYFNVNYSNGWWQKKNGDNWDTKQSGEFTEGTWRFECQVRIDEKVFDGMDGTTHKLASPLKVTVGEDVWLENGTPTVSDAHSYDWVYSPEYEVTIPAYKSTNTLANTSVTVANGTSEEAAIAALDATVGVVGTNSETGIADITWTIASYDGNTAGDYTASGVLTLPTGWTGAAPDVTAMVTVEAYVDPAAGAKAEVAKITVYALGTITVGDTDSVLEKAQALVGTGYTVSVKTADGTNISAEGIAKEAGEGTISFTVVKSDESANTADTETLNITVKAAALGGTVSIDGTLKFGEELTANVESLTGNSDTSTLTYTWKRESETIEANQAKYTTVEADIGKTITVEITSSVETGTIIGTASSTIEKAAGPEAPLVESFKTSGEVEDMIMLKNDGTDFTIKVGENKINLYEYSIGETDSWTYLNKVEKFTDAGDSILIRAKETDTHKAGKAAKVILTEGYVFNSNTGTIINYAGEATEITIPNTIDSVVVTAIDRDAFKAKELTSVTIPETVITIGTNAFMNNNLASIVIPNSVTHIATSAFEENQLTEITISDSIYQIGFTVFKNNNLTEVKIPDSVQVMYDNVFENNGQSSNSQDIPGTAAEKRGKTWELVDGSTEWTVK